MELLTDGGVVVGWGGRAFTVLLFLFFIMSVL